MRDDDIHQPNKAVLQPGGDLDAGGVSPTVQRAVKSIARAMEQSSVGESVLVDRARQMLRGRLKMIKLGPDGLFRDAAWDLLLELFISGEEGGVLYVKQLMIASGRSPAAAMRLLDRLEGANFITKEPDPLDQRRVIVRMTESSRLAMIAMLRQIFDIAAEPEHGPVSFQPQSQR